MRGELAGKMDETVSPTKVAAIRPLPYNPSMPRSSQKHFNTRCQEEVYRQVKSYLDELVDEHFDDAEHCDFYLKYGSTVLEISIQPFDEDDAIIEILAFCVQEVEPSFELMQELLRLNSEVPLGAFSLSGRNVFFSHAFLGRRLLGEQLIASLESVATISDEWDEKLVARYGGETALEHVRSDAQRTRAAVKKAAEN
jgi:hypothetical protein